VHTKVHTCCGKVRTRAPLPSFRKRPIGWSLGPKTIFQERFLENKRNRVAPSYSGV